MEGAHFNSHTFVQNCNTMLQLLLKKKVAAAAESESKKLSIINNVCMKFVWKVKNVLPYKDIY
jgi:hypothetical protein